MKAKPVSNIELPVDVGRDIINFKKLVDLKNSPGWIVDGDAVREWFFTGFETRENIFYLHGAPERGQNLQQVLSLPAKQALARLADLTAACERLLAHGDIPFDLQLDAVYLLKDGGILFLPPAIVRKVREFNPESYRFRVFAPCNNPYLQDQRARLSFSLGCFFYYVITGSFPYTGGSVEEINSKIRGWAADSPSLACPALKPELEEFFDSFFSDKLSFSLSLPDWRKLFDKYITEDFTRDISDEEKTLVLEQAQARAQKDEKRYRLHHFLERQGRTILFSTLAVIAVLIVLGYYLSGFFKPRLTKGYTPEQVVEAFYQGINELNPQLVADCVVGQAGKPEADEVNRLFVSIRQQYAMGFNKYISAAVWDSMGRPIIAVGQFVFGVTDLRITREENGPNPVFEASFIKWQRAEVGQDAKQLVVYPQGFRIAERLYLKQDGEDWVIFKRTRFKEEQLPPKFEQKE
jgi:hypothetical protein